MDKNSDSKSPLKVKWRHSNPFLTLRADVRISILLLNTPFSTMSTNFNIWRNDNQSQHTFPEMSPESSLMPTQSPPSPIDFTMGPIHMADDFAQTHLNWYTHSLHNASAAGPPPILFIVQENFPSPHQTSITIHTPASPCSPIPQAGFMPRTPQVNLPSWPQSPGLFAPNPLVQPNIWIGKSIASKPDLYDGDRTKYILWWCTVELYLTGFEKEPSDHQKVLIVLSYMKGQNAAGR